MGDRHYTTSDQYYRDVAMLAPDLNKGLAWARSLLGEMLQDKRVPQKWRDEIELFLEDEGNQTELEWVTENSDE